MPSGTIIKKKTISGDMSSSSGGTLDHTKLTNLDAADQHPISSIIDLQDVLNGIDTELDKKLEADDIQEIIDAATDSKAKGLYYDINSKFDKKPYWYLTSKIDENTRLGIPGNNGEYIISGPYDLGQGGGGGGGGSSSITDLTLTNKDPETGANMWPSAIALGGDEVLIKVYWSSLRDGESTGTGTVAIYVNNVVVETRTALQGLVSFNIASKIVSGDNKIEVKVTDTYSNTKNLIGTLTTVSLRLESNFEYERPYSGNINYFYTPYGNTAKTMHFIIDGVEDASSHPVIRPTGESQTYIIRNLSHGAHTFETYFTAEVGGLSVESNRLYYSLIADAGRSTTIIASQFRDKKPDGSYDIDHNQEQYISCIIPYRVYTPNRNNTAIKLLIDGVEIANLTVDSKEQYWEYKPTNTGNHILTIKAGTVTKDFEIYVAESTIKVEPVEDNLVLSLSAYGKNNTEIDKRGHWYDEVTHKDCTLENFNWSSDGWLKDTDGNTILRVAGNARVTIPYKPFETEIQNTGKTIEVEFATHSVKDYDSIIMSCLNGEETVISSIILAGDAEERTHRFAVDTLDEETFKNKVKDRGRYTFEYNEELPGWTLNGETVDLNEYGIVLKEVAFIEDDTPYYITHDRLIMNYDIVGHGFYITPQLARLQSQQSALSTQYKENEHVSLTFVIEKAVNQTRLVFMYINGIASGCTRYPVSDSFRQATPQFIQIGSNDAAIDIYHIRVYDSDLNRKQVVNNWIADTQDGELKAERYIHNDNFNEANELVIKKLPTDLPYLVMDITDARIPTAKDDKQNLPMQFVYPEDTTRSFTSEAVQTDVQGTSSQYYYKKNLKIKFKKGLYIPDEETGEYTDHYAIKPGDKKVKTFVLKADVASSEGANNVELVRFFELTKNWMSPAELAEPDKDGIAGSDRIRVGIDGFPIIAFTKNGDEVKFYGKMNFNNDKGTEDVYGFEDGDESWEVLNNTTALATFRSTDFTNWDGSFESRFPDDETADGHQYGYGPGELDKLQAMVTWVNSTMRSSEFSDAENARRLQKFKNELELHFNKESTLFYYLFTELFLMVDSRAKNLFPTYYKSRKAGDKGDRWYWIPYDMDTAIGINNEGLLVFDPYREDTDMQDGAFIFNGQDSIFWTNVRDAFPAELKEMYGKLRNKNYDEQKMAWSYENIERMFEEHQAKWSENIFNEDSYAKCIEPLVTENSTTYLGMLQGAKSEQRKWWLANRFNYLDSKYQTGSATANQIMMRVYKKSNITITPYINCYVDVTFDNALPSMMRSARAEKETPTTIIAPDNWDPTGGSEEGGRDAVFAILSADQLKDLGDLSTFNVGFANFAPAIKLQNLKLGDASPSYRNENLYSLSVGNNELLTKIDCRNCVNLGTVPAGRSDATPSVDLSGCPNIQEVYFEGTAITGIQLPVGGYLRVLHLPDTLQSLVIRNHPSLTDLQIAGTRYLNKLWLENIPTTTFNAKEHLASMPNGSAVRLIDIKEDYYPLIDGSTSKTGLDQIKEFYTDLERMVGLDTYEQITDIRQAVTGQITIHESISYEEYAALKERFPEVNIIFETIFCTVNFWNTTATSLLHDSQLIELSYANFIAGNGKAAVRPENPVSMMDNIEFYYTFEDWDTDFSNVLTDLDIKSIFSEHTQHYTVTFNTQSSAIHATPAVSDPIIYGGVCQTPPELTGIPEGVEFRGWWISQTTEDAGEEFVFGDEATPERPATIINNGNIIIYAHWLDTEAPTVSVSRQSFNTFKYTAHDNVGIIAWAVTNGEQEPTEWNYLESAETDISGTYEISSSGYWYIHIKDAQNNEHHSFVIAVNIEKAMNTGINGYIITDVQTLSEIGDFALIGTTISIHTEVNEHYENLQLYVDGELVEDGYQKIISNDISISANVDPKTYHVTFDSLGQGVTPEPQDIVYNNLIIEPEPQVIKDETGTSYIIEHWQYRGERWDFLSSRVEEDMTLIAYWIEYHDPTKLTVQIPEDNYEVTLCLSQDVADGAEICWHTYASTPEEIAANTQLSGSTYGRTNYITLQHTYATAGEYVISIKSRFGSYYLGRSDDNTQHAVNPISILTQIDFAFDMLSANNYAFANAVNLPFVEFTNYITNISRGMFSGCTGLTAIYLPNNIRVIEEEAFQGCSSITGIITIPSKVEYIGDRAFASCSGISQFILPETVTYIGQYCFAECEGLTSFTIPLHVTKIESFTFYLCTGLTELIIPETVESIEPQAVSFCANLEHLVFENPNLTYTATAGTPGNVFHNCPKLLTAGPLGTDEHYNIEFAWTTAIPAYAFDTINTALETVVIPEGVTTLGDDVFAHAQQLMNVSLPSTLFTIGKEAFYQCFRLQELNIPAKVKSIGDNFANYCIGLETLNIYATSSIEKAESINEAWFTGCVYNRLTVHIPAEVISDEIAKTIYGSHWNYRNEETDYQYVADLL